MSRAIQARLDAVAEDDLALLHSQCRQRAGARRRPVAEPPALQVVRGLATARLGRPSSARISRTHANEPMDYGFMYGRSFQDLDGHIWEVMWMSAEAVEKGPADMAHTAS